MMSAENAKNTIELLERADVTIDEVGISTGSLIDPRTFVYLKIKNFGRSVATAVTTRGKLLLSDGPTGQVVKPTELPIEEDAPPIVLPAAGGRSLVISKPFGEWIDQETITRINSSDIQLLLEIAITYRDVFGREHLTCFEGTFNATIASFSYRAFEAH